MNSRIFHALESLSVATVSAAALFALGAPVAFAAPAAEAQAAIQQATGQTNYLNGGIGAGSQDKMKSEAPNWPLHITFSEGAQNDYLADVRLTIHDAKGAEVLDLKNAGPLTYVRLTPGEYRISAEHKGRKEERSVNVGKSTAVNFHWGK